MMKEEETLKRKVPITLEGRKIDESVPLNNERNETLKILGIDGDPKANPMYHFQKKNTKKKQKKNERDSFAQATQYTRLFINNPL